MGQANELREIQQIPVNAPEVAAPAVEPAPFMLADGDVEVPEGRITVSKNVITVLYRFKKAGDRAWSHKHIHDHQTFITGRMRLHMDGRVKDFTGPCIVVVPAGATHCFEALLSESTVVCFHALRGPDGEPLGEDQDGEVQPISLEGGKA